MNSSAQRITDDNKRVANHAAKSFGGKPSVSRFHHENAPLHVDVLECKDKPSRGVTSYSTIGLSDFVMKREDGTEFPTRLELAGACASSAEKFPNVIASLAFRIMRNRELVYPGLSFHGFVEEYSAKTTVPHVFVTAPFLWESTLVNVQCDGKNVSWLLVVPVSDAEIKLLEMKGDDALETLFEKAQIDIFDLTRDSVV